jgi:hypothetical protein
LLSRGRRSCRSTIVSMRCSRRSDI